MARTRAEDMSTVAATTDVVPSPSSLHVSFIVPVRNDAARLRECLRAIRANTHPSGDLEIVVIDNGSIDGSPDEARAEGARVLVLPGLPVAQLRNAGAEAAVGDVLAFVDADHLIDPDWVARAADMLRDPAVGAVGAPYLTPAAASWVQRAYGRLRPPLSGVCDVEWLGSGNMAIRREVFAAVGGFDTTLETCEDVDLSRRVRAAGYRVVGDGRLRSVHLGDPASLKALFFSEMWRGRDNIRVTLRGRLVPRSLPSVIIPIVNLLLLVTALVAPFAAPRGAKLTVTLAALAGVAALAALRAIRMTLVGPVGPGEVARNLAVGGVYEVARALALVVRASHRTRSERGNR